MTAEEIRKFYIQNIAGELDGSLDEHNLQNALLGEIAAQLAELNDRSDPSAGSDRAARLATICKQLMLAGDEMSALLRDLVADGSAAIDSAREKWKKARGD